MPLFKCYICGATFDTLKEKVLHMWDKHRVRRY